MTALADLLAKQFGGKYFVQLTDLSPANGVITQVVDHNFERVGLTMVNVGSSGAFFSPDRKPSTTHGIFLGPSGGQVSLIYADDLALVGWEWSVFVNGTGGAIHVIEIIRYNPGPQ